MSPTAKLTIAVGGALIIAGPAFYFGSGRTSATALIPAALGLALAVCGLLSRSPRSTKIAMHAATLIAFIGLIGSARVFAKWSTLSATARSAQLLTLGLCLLLIVVYIRSFVAARSASPPSGAADD